MGLLKGQCFHFHANSPATWCSKSMTMCHRPGVHNHTSSRCCRSLTCKNTPLEKKLLDLKTYQLNNLDDRNILADCFHNVGIQSNEKKAQDFAQFYFPPDINPFLIARWTHIHGMEPHRCILVYTLCPGPYQVYVCTISLI